RYNQMKWITVDALDQHWIRADIDAEIVKPTTAVSVPTFRLTTKNIAAFTIGFSAAQIAHGAARIVIDGQELTFPPDAKSQWPAYFRKSVGKWARVPFPGTGTLEKHHGLTGPID